MLFKEVIVWLSVYCLCQSHIVNVSSEAINVAIDATPSALLSNESSNSINGPCYSLFKSSVTRQHPRVIFLPDKTTAIAAKFISLSSRPLDMYWDDSKKGVEQGTLQPGAVTTTNTYHGHMFYFTPLGQKHVQVARITMDDSKTAYPIYDEDYPGDPVTIELMRAEERFSDEYFQRTGVRWRHYYGPNGPRPPPVLPLWPAPIVGVVHGALSHHGFWSCSGSAAECQSPVPVSVDLECVSVSPRVFIIENFLSDYEADAIIASARGRVQRSGVGDSGNGRTSDTRTSHNAWLPRDLNAVTATVSQRVADILRMDVNLLDNAEQMQVVHYAVGQRYEPHHDWGVDGHPESRFITILMYLTDPVDEGAGGETAFPKSGSDSRRGFKVVPSKGSAVLFYNLLEDGNGDDFALHAALPVHRGEKWLANYWIWDPIRL